MSYPFQHSPQQIFTSPQIDLKVGGELQKHGSSNKSEMRGPSLSARTPYKINIFLPTVPTFAEANVGTVGMNGLSKIVRLFAKTQSSQNKNVCFLSIFPFGACGVFLLFYLKVHP